MKIQMGMSVSEILSIPLDQNAYDFERRVKQAAGVLHSKNATRYDDWLYINLFVGEKVHFARKDKQPDGTFRYPEQLQVTRGGRLQRLV